MEAWLIRNGQTPRIREMLWDPLALAALNQSPRQAAARRYLRANIRYFLGDEELEGLTAFYRYSAELGLVSFDGTLRFYDADDQPAR